ncbi:hypothetical protein BC936DRAFT_139876 [Jimgerdemannia flammicorona]|uniref:Uncharacterized protein n=1 Tax=Jimgerdemannia flammicorona TaxID=994334 RepID=A0A433B8Y5_9FUNG|nr:hypothetical protein BC936DRAFT_139876 [Jimgerdemannia flammicorona]
MTACLMRSRKIPMMGKQMGVGNLRKRELATDSEGNLENEEDDDGDGDGDDDDMTGILMIRILNVHPHQNALLEHPK